MKKQRLWLGMVIILMVWQVLYLLMDARLVPGPVSTLLLLAKLLLKGDLVLHMGTSLYRLTAAVVAALSAGLAIGVIMGMSPRIDRVLGPVIYLLFPVPKAALLPIIFLFFGLGDLSKIILIWLILVFHVILSVYDSVRNIPAEVFVSAKTLRLSQRQLYRHVVVPAIFPDILSALKTSVGIGIAVLFFAETYATDKGLGYFIMSNWSLLNYEEMYAGILLIGGMGYAVFALIDRIRHRYVHWL